MSRSWLLDPRDIPQRVGEHRDFERTVVLAEPLGTEVIAIPAGTSLRISGSVDAVDQGVLVRATGSASARGACVRCLETVCLPVRIDACEIYYLPAERERLVEQGDEEAEEARVIDDEGVDLAGLIIDALVPQLPYAPVCNPDCPGLCAQCGTKMAAAEAGHAHQQVDPRWQALAGLFTEE